MSFVLLWLGVMFPLVFSPGPANIVFAASGAGVGFRRSLPLVCGVDLVFVLKSALIGYGAGQLLSEYPEVLNGLQLIGASYLFYLAFGFLKRTVASGNQQTFLQLSFLDGVVIQLLNAKGWIMVVLMFSLFVEPAKEFAGSYAELSLITMLFILNVLTHLAWVMFGDLFARMTGGSKGAQWQGYFYFGCLLMVACWLLVDNPIWKSFI